MNKINQISKKYNILNLKAQIIEFQELNEITINTKIDNFIELENLANDIKKTDIVKKFNNIIINHNIKIENQDISKIKDTDNLSFIILGDIDKTQQILIVHLKFDFDRHYY